VRARQDIGVPDPLGTLPERVNLEPLLSRVDAEGEHRRLIEARRLTAGLPSVGDAGVLVTTARSRLRARIASSPLAIVRRSLADGAGRLIAHDLCGVLVAVTGRPCHCSLADVQVVLDGICARLVNRESADDGWAREAANIHAAFWARRVGRERAIWEAVMRQLAVPSQPGLFWKHQAGDRPADPLPVTGAQDPASGLRTAERRQAFTASATLVPLLLAI
jgi:hypothetical protein